MKNQRKRPILVGLLVLVVLGVVLRLTTSKALSKQLQELFQHDDNLISKMVNRELTKNHDEVLAKIDKLFNKIMTEQDKRLTRLERQNQLLLDEVRLLKLPPEKGTLRERLTYLFPYDPLVKFPAYVWQLWKHGLNDDRFDQQYKDGEAQWAWKNPGFVHELFNDDTAHTMIKYLYRQVPEVVQTYEKLPEVILKMDFFRYLILFAKGGVYADIDTYPLQPIPNWIPENVLPDELGMILLVELENNAANWKEDSHRRLQFGQFVLQAKPGHPVLREIIARIIEHTIRKLNSLLSDERLRLPGHANDKQLEILKWTGAGVWTDVVFHYFNDWVQSLVFQLVSWKDFRGLKKPKLVSDVLVMPIKLFALDHAIPKDGKIEDPLAFVKHYSAEIWKNA